MVAFVQDQLLERRHPTPREWSFRSRVLLRGCTMEETRTDTAATNWVDVGVGARTLVERLEDAKIDGQGLRRVVDEGEGGDGQEGPFAVDGVGALGYDVSAKSEPWRRGYHAALMMAARAAEHLDGWVIDPTQNNTWFPPEMVQSDTNPYPAPLPAQGPGFTAKAARRTPLAKDCVVGFPAPDVFYLRVLTTRGFTPRQKLDAALAYAAWLDFKALHEAAGAMLDWALGLAVEGSVGGPQKAAALYDPKTYVLKTASGKHGTAEEDKLPSANLLAALTAIGLHKARTGDVSGALSIFVSLLRARRSLPRPSSSATSPTQLQQEQQRHHKISAAVITDPSQQVHDRRPNESPLAHALDSVRGFIGEPPYPPPPPDGSAPPIRDSAEICEEAALELYVGEILFASDAAAGGKQQTSGSKKGASSSLMPAGGREEGLAWTREAVDVAEEELHRMLGVTMSRAAGTDDRGDRAVRVTAASRHGNVPTAAGVPDPSTPSAKLAVCRSCLTTGLANWDAMVARMRREEEQAAASKTTATGASPATTRSSWFGFWDTGVVSPSTTKAGVAGTDHVTDGRAEHGGGRWAAEARLVEERRRRAREVLEDKEVVGPPGLSWWEGLFTARG